MDEKNDCVLLLVTHGLQKLKITTKYLDVISMVFADYYVITSAHSYMYSHWPLQPLHSYMQWLTSGLRGRW